MDIPWEWCYWWYYDHQYQLIKKKLFCKKLKEYRFFQLRLRLMRYQLFDLFNFYFSKDRYYASMSGLIESQPLRNESFWCRNSCIYLYMIRANSNGIQSKKSTNLRLSSHVPGLWKNLQKRVQRRRSGEIIPVVSSRDFTNQQRRKISRSFCYHSSKETQVRLKKEKW